MIGAFNLNTLQLLWIQETGGEDKSTTSEFVKAAILFNGEGYVFV
jgi:hypothetical protein